MIIEFADPGYDWGFFWWPLGVLVLAIGLAVFLASIDRDIPAPVLGIPIAAMLMVPTLFGVSSYGTRVGFEKMEQIESLGFSNVELSGDRFTAATEDGEYFRGVLVDLEPDEGYAYQVLELTEGMKE